MKTIKEISKIISYLISYYNKGLPTRLGIFFNFRHVFIVKLPDDANQFPRVPFEMLWGIYFTDCDQVFQNLLFYVNNFINVNKPKAPAGHTPIVSLESWHVFVNFDNSIDWRHRVDSPANLYLLLTGFCSIFKCNQIKDGIFL